MSTGSAPNGPARAGGARTPLAYVIDNESSARSFLTLILQRCSVDVAEYSDSIHFRKSPPSRPPDIIFLNVGNDAQDSVNVLTVLAKSGYPGPVQLMSGRPGRSEEHTSELQSRGLISYGDHRDLPSFPTRRSSDLSAMTRRIPSTS